MHCNRKKLLPLMLALTLALSMSIASPLSLVASPQGKRAQAAKQRKKKAQKPSKIKLTEKEAPRIEPPMAGAREPYVERAQKGPKQEKDDYQVEREFYAQRTYGNRPIPPNAYGLAKAEWNRLQRTRGRGPSPKGGGSAKISSSIVSSLGGSSWLPIGPNGIIQGTAISNGRVSAIAVNPNNPNLIYQGSSGGGLWRTTNGGSSWSPLYDQQVSLGIGESTAVAVDPSNTNTIYVGTSGRFVQNISRGILKSVDGGASWIVLGSDFPMGNSGNADALFAGRAINAIIVDPTNPNTLYLAASNGLYRSIDAGRNWTQGTNGTGDAQYLTLDTTSTTNPRILYAGVNSVGIRQSTDGGQTWTNLPNFATAVNNFLAPGQTFGKVAVALAPPTAPANTNGIQVLYATTEGQGTGVTDPTGVYVSTDQGQTWTRQTSTGIPGNTQGGYNLTIGVDPNSPGDGVSDIIYIAAVGQGRSTDSGNNFANAGNGQHVDTHADWVFIRQALMPPIILTGNDGGIWRSLDNSASWTGTGIGPAPPTINAGGLQTALFYNIDINANGSVTEGGLQDNGTVRYTGPGLTAWTDTQGGDGWDIAFDSQNANNAYNTSGFWSPAPCTRVWKSTNGGASWPTDVTPWGVATDQGCYLAPVNADPNVTDRIYASGSQNLWQTSNGGTNWRNIWNSGGAAQVNVARGNSNNVVASVGTQVFVSTNVLTPVATDVTFTNITRNLPTRFVTRVTFDPNDPTVIYATLSGFNNQTPVTPGHVFRTTIGGTTWTDISPTVDVPYNAIALDGGPAPSAIYVGNDLGVMRSVDGGANWTVLDDVHFPNVPVTDLVIHAATGRLVASTFGRGVFELSAATGPVISVNLENGLDFGNACQGGASNLTVQVFNNGTQNLLINSVQRLFGSTDFTVAPNPATPVNVAPGEEIDFTVKFTPTSNGPQTAQFRISSNDPNAPFFDVFANGTGGVAVIDTFVANSGNFGQVCVGSFKDLEVTINNSGTCDLSINNITSSSSQFLVAGTVSFPLIVAPGNSLQVPIRFQPTSIGAKSGNITISSNDPVNPSRVIPVSGHADPGDIRITGSSEFGDVCAGALAEKTVKVCNVGACNLNVTSVALNCTDFQLVNNPFPAVVSPDSCLDVTIRFTPQSVGPKTCSLTIASDDPDTPIVVRPVTGNTPVPAISVAPDLTFPATVLQSVGACNTQQPFLVTNIGTCPLVVTNMSIGGSNSADYTFIGLPALNAFPLILEPGHSVGEGDLRVAFAPLGQTVDRQRLGNISVTYVSDPILHALNPVMGLTTVGPRAMCGESVRTGARVLVTAGNVPVAKVEKLQLQRITGNRNRPIVDTVDASMNLDLQSVVQAAPCASFQYHKEYGANSNQIMLLPGSYRVTATVVIGKKRQSKTVAFDVTTCDFNSNITINF